MTFRLSNPQSAPRPGRRWLQLLLFAGFVLSLLIGLGALLGIYLLPEVEQEAAQITSDPVLLVEPARIPPHLALLRLAGAEGDSLVRQAANAGERTLAYSILIYDGTLTSTRQANESLRVGRLFLADGDNVRAVAAFNRARTAALFALPMAPLERGQLLVRSAEGLSQAGDVAGSLHCALQAQHVAAQAAGLLPAQRAQILQSLEPIIRTHGSSEESQRLNDLLRSPGQAAPRVALLSRLPELRADYRQPVTLDEARSQRAIAAKLLIDRVLLTGGQDIDLERTVLVNALQTEDRLWTEVYAGWNNSALHLPQRHGILLDYRDWLLVKRQAAEGGFGLRLVESWEGEQEQIRIQLGQVMGEMSALMAAQVDEVTDPLARPLLRLETLQWLALQTELGFYPNAPLDDLNSRMEATQAELETLGVPPDLPLFYEIGGQTPGFRIARRYQ